MTNEFRPGAVWLDTDGAPIQAHGGGILFHQGIYYWYGENKDGPTWEISVIHPESGKARSFCRVDVVGVSCYSSEDLYAWKNEGIVLAASADPNHDLHHGAVLERPKVIYHPTAKKFVMHLHADSRDYARKSVGVAVSRSPNGPFEYLGSYHPNGFESADMNIFLDDDGKAYHIFSSEKNATTHISLLSDDFLRNSGRFSRAFEGKKREAQCLFKRGNRYYLISSGCSGWDPNEAEVATAKELLGKWEVLGNPCVGPGAETTFKSQSTFVLPVAGKKDAYIFMADRWDKNNLRDSRYVWLPIRFNGDKPTMEWKDRWDLSVFE